MSRKPGVMYILMIGVLLAVIKISQAEPMGTACTYQGRLQDGDSPADGEYDLEFKLYTDPVSGYQVGVTVNKENEPVSAGLFTVQLDLAGSDPNAINGEARWLQIGVRPGDSSNAFTTLNPRQELTPTIYSIYAANTDGLFISSKANTFVGSPTGNTTTIGHGNSAVGFLALNSNTTGGGNSAMGSGALSSNTEGNYNAAMGSNALLSNINGSYNSAMGIFALLSNIDGNCNSAMGSFSLYDNTTGDYNSAMGNEALYSNTSGYNNSAMGYRALYLNTIGGQNTAIGNNALRSNTEGDYNTAFGSFSLYDNTIGEYNSAIGTSALSNNETGNYNTALGNRAGFRAQGSGNVFLGYRAGYNEIGSDRLYIANSEIDPPLIYGEFDTGKIGIGTNTPSSALTVAGTVTASAFIGDGSGLTGISGDGLGAHRATQNIDLNGNYLSGDGDDEGIYINDSGYVGIGKNNPSDDLDVDGNINASGIYKIGGQTILSRNNSNVNVGENAGTISSTGADFNTAVGDGSLNGLTTGDSNTAVGRLALNSNNSGTSNSAVGSDALSHNTTGNYNAAMGRYSLRFNTIGGRNSALGYGSLNYNTEADYNTAMGFFALYRNTIGQYNTAVGAYANDNNQQGSNNTIIGYMAGRGEGYHNKSGNIFLGYQAGYHETEDNKLYIENSSSSSPLIYGEFDNNILTINGSVGIGTTNPSTDFDVLGTIASDGLIVYSSVGIGIENPGAALDVQGNIRISDSSGNPVVEIGEGLDYAEGFDVSTEHKINPGAVLIIDSDNPGKLALSNKAYDRRVAGIVAGANGLGSGVRLGSGEFDHDVALAGRVYCNVDATENGIEPGDLLTTSMKPGYAMKVNDYTRAQGAILGKAMESLEKGHKGQILVLVTLQ
jgi:hypothetical protein